MFTKYLKELQNHESETKATRCKRKVGNEKDGKLFSPNCIFCGKYTEKYVKIKGVWVKKEPLNSFNYGNWKSVLSKAEEKRDEKLLCRIRGFDLSLCKAKFHKSCKSQYFQKPEYWRSSSIDDKQSQAELEEKHSVAFEKVVSIIETKVIEEKTILKLKDLCDFYVRELAKSRFPNDEYRSEKLKNKIEKHQLLSKHVTIIRVNKGQINESYILFNKNTPLDDAVRAAYKLGNTNVQNDVASDLRNTIFSKFKNSPTLPWPPSADYLHDCTDILPDDLKEFLSTLISGKSCSSSAKSS